MEKVTLCVRCEFAENRASKSQGLRLRSAGPSGVCLNPDAPIHDYVTGESLCYKLNEGDCKLFKRYAGNSNKGGE